jgi:hypothetical protein
MLLDRRLPVLRSAANIQLTKRESGRYVIQ